MKKLNRAMVIGLMGVVAAGVLTQGTPSLAAQNVTSKNAVIPTTVTAAWFTFKQAAGSAVAGGVGGAVGGAVVGAFGVPVTAAVVGVGAAAGAAGGAVGNIAQQAFHAVFGNSATEVE